MVTRSCTVLIALLASLLVPVTGSVSAAPATFVHPGVVVSRPQLDFMRTKVQAGAQPWKTAYDRMMATKYADLNRTPKPRAVVECGPVSNPNNGCTDEREDALAAYTLSLAWYVTRDARYATKAIQIMDAWSNTIRDHTNSNAPLQTAWSASSWPKAAEIIKHVYGTWPNSARFGTMLRNVYLPEIQNGRANTNGNWELSMMEASIGIAVFLEDKAAYDKAIGIFRTRIQAFIYLTTDGALPKTPPGSGIDTRAEIISYWHNQSTFVDGVTQETCRDFAHTAYGLSAASHLAETAWIQGQDIWGEIKDRMRHAWGLHSKYQNGEPMPSWLCGGTLSRELGPTPEVSYNALNTRLGIAMANTKIYTESNRPHGTDNLFIAWETLTHAANPS
ncbi:alginate lyase family protein [Lentzea sp. NBC_00516]|uniref:alginate lyase family protein n=1 Tax=Lentzea sp. NBC_00516 TaxID=2903582 RepID=UPI002E7FC83D|nr:alginate lyase family protein [Lentzea sp. NBC_00516]WUD25654.1 alginate lyase family protein [Lentzea sp. NBC_00516]